MAAARPLPHALTAFRAALGGKLSDSSSGSSDGGGNDGKSGGGSGGGNHVRDAHKLLRLQVYADACVLAPPHPSTQAQGEPSIVASPDRDCVSLAWWLSFNLPLNAAASTTNAGGEGGGGHKEAPLELTMELIGRVDTNDNDEVDRSSDAPIVGSLKNAQEKATKPSTELLLRRAAAAGLTGIFR